MEMFLMGLCLSLLGLSVTAVAFGAATRSQERYPEQQPSVEPVVTRTPAHFFSDSAVATAPSRPFQAPTFQVPIEALLLQIENHVRLEHAAAESFVAYPTAALLHGKTMSTFIQ